MRLRPRGQIALARLERFQVELIDQAHSPRGERNQDQCCDQQQAQG